MERASMYLLYCLLAIATGLALHRQHTCELPAPVRRCILDRGGPSRLDHLHTLHGAFLKRSALAPLALVAASFLPGRERQVLLAAVLTVGVIAEVRPAHAQPGPASIVRVRVADSAGTPL